MVSFRIFLTWISLLDVLVNTNEFTVHGAEIPDPDSNPAAVANPDETDLIIDDFTFLKSLAWNELKIVKHLIKAVEKLQEEKEQIPEKVEEYIEDFKRGNGGILDKKKWTKKTAENIAKNPISSYRLLYRFARDLSDLTFYMGNPVFDSAKNAITPELLDLVEQEGQADLKIASYGILTLQHIYEISAEEISQGKFPLIDLHAQLDAKHCFRIGLRALERNLSAQAVEWLELAVEKSKAEKMEEANQRKIQAKLESAIFKHDELFKNDSGRQNPTLFVDLLQSESNGTENHQLKVRKTRRQIYSEKFKGSRKLEHLDVTAAGVCAGENYQTEEEKRHLFCWREFKAHPKFLIGPLKMEFLSQDTDIIMIYDFIGDAAIKEIKRATKHRKTSKRYSENDSDRMKNLLGINGKGTKHFIWDGEPTPAYPSFDLLSVTKNVEAVLGHSVRKLDESALIYVRSYTFASKTKLHVDFQYVASFIHYLTDVELGGATAFPAAGISVKPVKGAAAVWFNQLRDRERNQKTMHMSCPVLFGRKIVATKWTTHDANIFKMNCALNKGQLFRIKVNGEERKLPQFTS